MIVEILLNDNWHPWSWWSSYSIEFLNTSPQPYSAQNSNVHKDLSTLFLDGSWKLISLVDVKGTITLLEDVNLTLSYGYNTSFPIL